MQIKGVILKSKKPKLTIVTSDNLHKFDANPQSRKGIAKGDKEYEEMKEALRQLLSTSLEVDPSKIQ